MSKYGLFGKFTVKDGERDTMVRILMEAAQSMNDLEDCEVYLVSTADLEPNSVYVYEEWKSEDAHQASLGLESTQTLIKQAKPIITGVERISTFQPIGGKPS
ncbi:putative quinol monooxygenase [Robertmurraya korlensis]|uniref:putative quinol monooxygenase n=1 Tax=Robertmurraya korlensis TaxID=519977 RepID=UPI000826A887|nr:putative quinol monooxygenase [Robertmurraya korlensis]